MDSLKVVNHVERNDPFNARQRRLRTIAHNWVNNLDPNSRWTFYAECQFCRGNNIDRENPDVRQDVKHAPDCDYPKLHAALKEG